MTETTESLDTSTGTAGHTDAAAPAKGRTRKGEGLSGMVLTDLKALAGTLGIKGTSGMRKGDLVAAIAARQSGAGASSTASSPVKETATRRQRPGLPYRRAGHGNDHHQRPHRRPGAAAR